MYIFYIFILAPLLQIGFSLIEEETDLNSLSNYEAVEPINENFESWNAQDDNPDIVVFNSISRPLLETICKNSNTLVYITQEDVTIDCKAFNNGDQPIENSINIVKRSAPDELEGSGDELEKETPPENESDNVNQEDAKNLETTVAAADVPNQTEVVPTEEKIEPNVDQNANEPNTDTSPVTEANQDTSTVIESIATDSAAQASDETSPDSAATTEEIPAVPDITQEPSEVTTTSQETINQTNPDLESQDIANPNNSSEANQDVEITTNQEAEKPQTQAPEPIAVEENNKIPVEQTEKEDVQNNETNQNSENTDKKKDAELMKGRTLIDLPKKEDNKVANPSDAANDEVKTNQSTENPKKAGTKDTTILICLFAAVVVVGALAFGYNFIRKRRQSADLESTERNAPIKRSLQSLTKAENEPERKPLIDDNKEVEMVNMKKESPDLQPTPETAPSESTVKT